MQFFVPEDMYRPLFPHIILGPRGGDLSLEGVPESVIKSIAGMSRDFTLEDGTVFHIDWRHMAQMNVPLDPVKIKNIVFEIPEKVSAHMPRLPKDQIKGLNTIYNTSQEGVEFFACHWQPIFWKAYELSRHFGMEFRNCSALFAPVVSLLCSITNQFPQVIVEGAASHRGPNYKFTGTSVANICYTLLREVSICMLDMEGEPLSILAAFFKSVAGTRPRLYVSIFASDYICQLEIPTRDKLDAMTRFITILPFASQQAVRRFAIEIGKMECPLISREDGGDDSEKNWKRVVQALFIFKQFCEFAKGGDYLKEPTTIECFGVPFRLLGITTQIHGGNINSSWVLDRLKMCSEAYGVAVEFVNGVRADASQSPTQAYFIEGLKKALFLPEDIIYSLLETDGGSTSAQKSDVFTCWAAAINVCRRMPDDPQHIATIFAEKCLIFDALHAQSLQPEFLQSQQLEMMVTAFILKIMMTQYSGKIKPGGLPEYPNIAPETFVRLGTEFTTLMTH